MHRRIAVVFIVLWALISACSDARPVENQDPGPGEGELCGEVADCAEPGPQQSVSCSDEGECLFECVEGYASCDSELSTGCEADLRSLEHCGACGEVCDGGPGNFAHSCEAGQCVRQEGECAEGFVNLNGSDEDGCECEIISEEDTPETPGDLNCDGIDGMLAEAIFVTSDGLDSNGGLTPDRPLATIERGLVNAAAQGRKYVLVAQGTFDEVVVLREGISIYGGYAPDFSYRDPSAYRTRIEVSNVEAHQDRRHQRTVIADGLEAPAVVDGVSIFGPDAHALSGEGVSSYAVWANNSLGLVLRDVEIDAGRGSRGSDGAAGLDGVDRECGNSGGSGGAISTAAVNCAGRGATGEDGGVGSNAIGGGIGGLGGANSCPAEGFCQRERGFDGEDGHHGLEIGAPGSTGSPQFELVDGLLSVDEGQGGGNGEDGSGGGGGGAESDCVHADVAGTVLRGRGGGRGGDGGCGGGGGENGRMGGGAFGLFVIDSQVTLERVDVLLGLAGPGGDGGAGGLGAPADHSTRDGAQVGWRSAGGFGGDGAHGGGGAGGCGGPSVGLAWRGTAPEEINLTLVGAPAPALGGSGAYGGDPDGPVRAEDGCPGLVTQRLELAP